MKITMDYQDLNIFISNLSKKVKDFIEKEIQNSGFNQDISDDITVTTLGDCAGKFIASKCSYIDSQKLFSANEKILFKEQIIDKFKNCYQETFDKTYKFINSQA